MRPLKALALISVFVFVAAACNGEDATPKPTPAPTAQPTAAADATSAPTLAPAPTAEVTIGASPEPAAAAQDTAPVSAALAPASIGEPQPATMGEPQPAPELAGLVNPDGTTFDLADFKGTNTLVFFGYTHCPDVCPTTIGELFGVFKASPETQAVFISVDPERDTPAFLEEWTAYFPENFNAVTGSPGAIRRAADNYGVKYARVETTSTSGYTMSHTADLYLIDENGQLRLAYPFGTAAAKIVEDLSQLNAG